MAFLFWTLFIISFLLTVSIILAVLQKKYHGWKSFFTILRNVNILFVCLVSAYTFFLLWISNGYGMVLLLLPITLLPLLIIDFIVVLPYFFIRHWQDKSKIIIYAALVPAICLLFILSLILLRFLS